MTIRGVGGSHSVLWKAPRRLGVREAGAGGFHPAESGDPSCSSNVLAHSSGSIHVIPSRVSMKPGALYPDPGTMDHFPAENVYAITNLARGPIPAQPEEIEQACPIIVMRICGKCGPRSGAFVGCGCDPLVRTLSGNRELNVSARRLGAAPAGGGNRHFVLIPSASRLWTGRPPPPWLRKRRPSTMEQNTAAVQSQGQPC